MEQPTLKTRLQMRERPPRSPVMYQTWQDLLFAHWEWDAAEIQQTLPPGLFVDTFANKAYLGIVPFFMRDVRPRFTFPVPPISNFMELNVRTYVFDEHGTPGVWFYSLDADQWLAVKLARSWFGLPYHHAVMASRRSLSGFSYTCRRLRRNEIESTRFIYRPTGEVQTAAPESLEFFLLERYILFSYHEQKEQLSSGQVHHEPYPYQAVQLSTWDDKVLGWDDFERPHRPPDHALFSSGVSVDIFGLQVVNSATELSTNS